MKDVVRAYTDGALTIATTLLFGFLLFTRTMAAEMEDVCLGQQTTWFRPQFIEVTEKKTPEQQEFVEHIEELNQRFAAQGIAEIKKVTHLATADGAFRIGNITAAQFDFGDKVYALLLKLRNEKELLAVFDEQWSTFRIRDVKNHALKFGSGTLQQWLKTAKGVATWYTVAQE